MRWTNLMNAKARKCAWLGAIFYTSAGTVEMCNTHVRYCRTCNPQQLDEDYSILEILEAEQ